MKQAEEKTAVLVVSFGTSYSGGREKAIGAVERAVARACPGCAVRRAFTSRMILDILKKRDNLEIDYVDRALERLAADGVRRLAVQPTYVMSGYEYDEMMGGVERWRDKFDRVAVGAPLLNSDEDCGRVAAVLIGEHAGRGRDGTAVVLMGHGTEHAANAVYARLQERFFRAGADNYLVGTVEAEPSLQDMLDAVKKGGYRRVVLEPLMLAAGDHAHNDMAGDGEGSWKSAFEAEGFPAEILLKGLGEIAGIRQIYADHARAALDALR